MPIIVTGTFQHPQVAPDMHGNVKHMTPHHVCSASALPWTAFGKRRSANNEPPKLIATTPEISDAHSSDQAPGLDANIGFIECQYRSERLLRI